MSARRRTTARDVATRLGVSTKTVANAFSRPDQLSRELRDRVLSTADELGYAGPNPLSGRLRRGRVGAIGIAYDTALSYAFEDPAAVSLLAGAAGVLEPAGASLLLVAGSSDPATSVAAAGGALVDALIISSVGQDDPFLHAALARDLPTVIIDQPDPVGSPAGGALAGVPWVGIDDAAAATEATAHLLSLGHLRYGVVSFPMTASTTAGLADTTAQARSPYRVTRQRLRGYRTALADAGVRWTDVPVAHGTHSTPDGGHAAAELLLARSPRPTALMCMSDRLAEGAHHAAARRGLSVPRDLSIVGFDDSPPAERLDLTTVANPQRGKGEHAARAVLQMLDGRSAPARALLPTSLVVRNSTAAPPPDD